MRSQVALARFWTMSSGVHPISRSSFTSRLCQAASVISAPGIFTDPIPSGSCAVNVNDPDRLGSRMMKPVSRSEPIKFSTRGSIRSEEHTSELQSRENLVCRLLLEKKKTQQNIDIIV